MLFHVGSKESPGPSRGIQRLSVNLTILSRPLWKTLARRMVADLRQLEGQGVPSPGYLPKNLLKTKQTTKGLIQRSSQL